VKILIGNHIDPAIRDREDLRAWTQRVLWFANEGDLVILSHEPDQRFLRHATSLTGVDPRRLHIVSAPEGPHRGLLLDPASLDSPQLHKAVRAAVDLQKVDDIFALWPSASVTRFAEALDIADRLPAAEFLAQRGGELCNNKAVFRAMAAAAGVPIPAGTVCHSIDEATAASADLLTRTGALVIKQAHNGAGMGNQLLIGEHSLAVDHVGARHLHQLASASPQELTAYWAERWEWASVGGRFPAVIEEFIPGAETMYSEYLADNNGTQPTEMGSLHYVGRRLSHQVVPLRGISHDVRQRLLEGGARLAEAYRALGYRGYLSADAIVTADGHVLFTEVNAQVSGSLHIYKVIGHGIVGVAELPHRNVVEYHVPPSWAVPDWDTFASTVEELGCSYDPATHSGVIVSMPIIPLVAGLAQFVFCIAYATEQERRTLYGRLDEKFNKVPAGVYSASQRVGIPTAVPA